MPTVEVFADITCPFTHVGLKRVVTDQLGVDDFSGFNADRWPSTTLPALNLAAAAYERDAATGLAVSLDLRAALFERGLDVSDPEVLSDIAFAHDLAVPTGMSSTDSTRPIWTAS